MGFHLRKSFKCGPIRFNLSNSGIGYSLGVKGLRVGVDGKGRSYIGGGKGVLRYRKTFSASNKTNGEIISLHETVPETLKIILSTKVKIILFILFSPLWLLFLIVGVYLLFEGIGGVIFSLMCFYLAFIIPYFMFFSKDIKMKNYANKAIKAYNIQNFEQAILNFELADTNIPKNAHWELTYYFREMIYNCYIATNNFESALEYLKCGSGIILPTRKEKKIFCLYQLERFEDLVKYIQSEYTTEERNEHPTLFAMLGEAFLKLGQNSIALETLLTGPVRKRNMDDEMCAFRYVLGKCYEANNDKDNALKQYQKVYGFDVDYEDVSARIKNLTT